MLLKILIYIALFIYGICIYTLFQGAMKQKKDISEVRKDIKKIWGE